MFSISARSCFLLTCSNFRTSSLWNIAGEWVNNLESIRSVRGINWERKSKMWGKLVLKCQLQLTGKDPASRLAAECSRIVFRSCVALLWWEWCAGRRCWCPSLISSKSALNFLHQTLSGSFPIHQNCVAKIIQNVKSKDLLTYSTCWKATLHRCLFVLSSYSPAPNPVAKRDCKSKRYKQNIREH